MVVWDPYPFGKRGFNTNGTEIYAQLENQSSKWNQIRHVEGLEGKVGNVSMVAWCVRSNTPTPLKKVDKKICMTWETINQIWHVEKAKNVFMMAWERFNLREGEGFEEKEILQKLKVCDPFFIWEQHSTILKKKTKCRECLHNMCKTY